MLKRPHLARTNSLPCACRYVGALLAAISLIIAATVTIRELDCRRQEKAASAISLYEHTRLLGRELKDRLERGLSETSHMARYDMQPFFQGQRDIGVVADQFQAGLVDYADIMAYTLVDGSGELVYARGVESAMGESAVNQSLAWAKNDWAMLDDQTGPFIPPPAHGFLGMLVPVRLEHETMGALVVAHDLRAALEHCSAVTMVSQPCRRYILDREGLPIAGPPGGPDGISFVDEAEKTVLEALQQHVHAQPTGTATYPVKDTAGWLDGRRYLLAWDSFDFHGRTMVIAQVAILSAAHAGIIRYVLLIGLPVLMLLGLGMVLMIWPGRGASGRHIPMGTDQ